MNYLSLLSYEFSLLVAYFSVKGLANVFPTVKE